MSPTEMEHRMHCNRPIAKLNDDECLTSTLGKSPLGCTSVRGKTKPTHKQLLELEQNCQPKLTSCHSQLNITEQIKFGPTFYLKRLQNPWLSHHMCVCDRWFYRMLLLLLLHIFCRYSALDDLFLWQRRCVRQAEKMYFFSSSSLPHSRHKHKTLEY